MISDKVSHSKYSLTRPDLPWRWNIPYHFFKNFPLIKLTHKPRFLSIKSSSENIDDHILLVNRS